MKSKAAVARRTQLHPGANWLLRNFMIFPQALRDAIPGPNLPGCDRSLILSSIDGALSHSVQFGGMDLGPRVLLNFRVEESGNLTGAFEVKAHLNVEAARALAATLQELAARLEKPA